MSDADSNYSLIINKYVEDFAAQRESPLLAELRQVTEPMPWSQMQVSVEQGRLLSFLTLTSNARRIIELGVFTGYSSICLAEHLPPDGELIACDVSEEWTAIARDFWKKAGIADKIQLEIAPARETLTRLLEQGQADSFDLVFIDADKVNYPDYYELSLLLLRAGGLMVLYNMFQGGRVADPASDDDNTEAVRDVTNAMLNDDRVDCSLIPIRDGIALVRKR